MWRYSFYFYLNYHRFFKITEKDVTVQNEKRPAQILDGGKINQHTAKSQKGENKTF